MRVLVITRAPWRNDNNTGNTMSNLFSNMRDVKFYNLFFRDQLPNNNISIKNLSISEMQIIKGILKGRTVGKFVNEYDGIVKTEEKLYSSAKKHQNTLFLWLREMLWSIGNWKKGELKHFLEEINPDIVFMPVFNCFYPHKVLKFIKQHTNAKIVLFHADDNYTLKHFSLSPFFWLYRFNLRKWVKKSVEISSLNYAISYLQKKEYEKAFDKPFKVLTKSADFSNHPSIKNEYNNPLQLVFTGNITSNRWKSLEHIANVFEKINQEGLKIQLHIYTGNPITPKINKALNKNNSSIIMGYVSADKIARLQNEADMLVHVEALDLKNKLAVRQSFSTKIVDYLAAARPILAFGPKDVASINHLIKNDCAIVADNEKELYEKLVKAIDAERKLNELSLKSFECGKKFHNKEDIDNMLRNDMEQLIKGV